MYAEASVARNRDVVLAVFEGGQPKMATGLTVHPVAQVGEGLREIVTGDVPRQPQAMMISSRTKWRRMTFVRLRPAGEAAFRPPGPHGKGAKGAKRLSVLCAWRQVRRKDRPELHCVITLFGKTR